MKNKGASVFLKVKYVQLIEPISLHTVDIPWSIHTICEWEAGSRGGA